MPGPNQSAQQFRCAPGPGDHFDDKSICAQSPTGVAERARILVFFRWYGRCKALLNLVRGQWGSIRSVGWSTVEVAITRARPLCRDDRHGAAVRF
jgi:hypothetical protein